MLAWKICKVNLRLAVSSTRFHFTCLLRCSLICSSRCICLFNAICIFLCTCTHLPRVQTSLFAKQMLQELERDKMKIFLVDATVFYKFTHICSVIYLSITTLSHFCDVNLTDLIIWQAALQTENKSIQHHTEKQW